MKSTCFISALAAGLFLIGMPCFAQSGGSGYDGYYTRYPAPAADNGASQGQPDSFAVGTVPPPAARGTGNVRPPDPGLPPASSGQSTPGTAAQDYGNPAQGYPGNPNYSATGYDPVQFWDGWGAVFVGAAEPIVFRPAVRIKDCLSVSSGGARAAAAPACAIYGVVEGLFYTVFDTTVGAADILTFGYFKISRQAGVFDYFK